MLIVEYYAQKYIYRCSNLKLKYGINTMKHFKLQKII